MERILIIGCPGAGKTTFALQLAEKLQLPLIHLDNLYWKQDWKHWERELFDKALQDCLEAPQWIMDGNFNRTIPQRLKYCDTVFFLDFPTITCLAGITRRTLQNLGRARPDMAEGCIEAFDRNKLILYRSVLTFRRQHRKAYLQLLAQADGVDVRIFRSRRQLRAFLANCPQQPQ